MHYIGSVKRKLNKEMAKKLKIDDTVKVKKTGEVGVVKGFVVYGTGQEGEFYDYTSIKVFFPKQTKNRKKNRRFSGSSLIKL